MGRASNAVGATSSLPETLVLAAQLDGRKDAILVGPTIDPDPPVVTVRMGRGRVTMHDDLLKASGVGQEGLPHPTEVSDRLPGERHVWINARMNKHIVAKNDAILETPEETSMGGGERVLELLLCLSPTVQTGFIFGGSYAVGPQGGHPTIARPSKTALNVGEKFQHGLFMIAA